MTMTLTITMIQALPVQDSPVERLTNLEVENALIGDIEVRRVFLFPESPTEYEHDFLTNTAKNICAYF